MRLEGTSLAILVGMRSKKILLVMLLGINVVALQGRSEELTQKQFEALEYTVKYIKLCGSYSINYGANNPYSETCVIPLANSAIQNISAFLSHSEAVIAQLERIKSCPHYSINYGMNKPLEEGCVNLLVDTVVDGLEMRRSVAQETEKRISEEKKASVATTGSAKSKPTQSKAGVGH
jgi:hypothetical protein